MTTNPCAEIPVDDLFRPDGSRWDSVFHVTGRTVLDFRGAVSWLGANHKGPHEAAAQFTWFEVLDGETTDLGEQMSTTYLIHTTEEARMLCDWVNTNADEAIEAIVVAGASADALIATACL